MGENSLRIRFKKINGLIKIYNGVRNLELFDSYNEFCYRNNSRIYNTIFDRITYLISEKSGIKDSINHNFGRIRIDSCNSLPNEKPLTFYNVRMLNSPVVNENKNDYYYNIFLKKVSIKNPIHNIFK